MNADEITSAKSEGTPLRPDGDGLLRHVGGYFPAGSGEPFVVGQKPSEQTIPRIPANPARPTDSIVIKVNADTADLISSLEATRVKLVEVEQQAERTAAALAKVKLF